MQINDRASRAVRHLSAACMACRVTADFLSSANNDAGASETSAAMPIRLAPRLKNCRRVSVHIILEQRGGIEFGK